MPNLGQLGHGQRTVGHVQGMDKLGQVSVKQARVRVYVKELIDARDALKTRNAPIKTLYEGRGKSCRLIDGMLYAWDAPTPLTADASE